MVSHEHNLVTSEYKSENFDMLNGAYRLYRYFQGNARATPSTRTASTDKLWADAVDQMIVSMRLKRLAHRTEQTHVSWMRKFYRYVKCTKPLALNSKHVTDFLTYLAMDRKVARSTQNQAFNAILFFYRHVLKLDIQDIWAKPLIRVCI